MHLRNAARFRVSLCMAAFALSAVLGTLLVIPRAASAQNGTVRIMPLGDSITTHTNSLNSYRRSLWHTLQDAGYNVDFVGSRRVDDHSQLPPNQDFDMDYEGHPGWRVDNLQASVRGWMDAQRPQIVLLHAGTNDLIQGQSVESTANELSQLIDTMRASNANVTILIAQIIPFNLTNSQNVPLLNTRIAALAASKNTSQSRVIVVDQYSGFNVNDDTRDGVHPNAGGERKLANRWYQALTRVLGSPGAQPPRPVSPGNGRGLTGRYFDTVNFRNRRATRLDPTINFFWNAGSPSERIAPDTFSARWTGRVVPLYSERYTFYTTADDGVRLWVNNRLLINNWTDQGPTERSGTIRLRAGRRYRIRLEYYDRRNNASLTLSWSSASQPKQIIPQSQLFPTRR